MSKALVKGSLAAIATKNNASLAETFLGCDVLILADMSRSMSTQDAQGNKSRYEVAEQDIIRLQEMHEGKVALVVFSNYPLFCPTGKPDRIGGGTELATALKFIKPIDGTGVKIIIVSDGEPFDKQECLRLAKTFETALDVVYVGNEQDLAGGRKFLEQLAAASGGSFIKSDEPGKLFQPVEQLMLTG